MKNNSHIKISKILSISWAITIPAITWYFYMVAMAATERLPNSTYILARFLSISVFWHYPFFTTLIVTSMLIQLLSMVFSIALIKDMAKSKEGSPFLKKLIISHLFFGGFITSWAVTMKLTALHRIKEKAKDKVVNLSGTIKLKNIGIISVVASNSFLFLPIPALYFSEKLSNNNFEDHMYEFESISLSTDPNHPNVIEWFHDGLSPNMFNEFVQDDSSFNDFTAYTRVITEGYNTGASMRGMFGGPEYGVWNNRSSNITQHFYEHLAQGEHSDNISIVGPQPFRDWDVQTGYHSSWSGGVSFLKERFPDLNILGWKEARDKLVEEEGVNGFSPDFATHYYAFNTFEQSVDNTPARIYINDHFSHFPYVTDSDGTLNVLPGTNQEGYEALSLSVDIMIERLKSIVNPDTGLSAYDNSTIVIYGDHGSHVDTTLANDETGPTGKNRTMFMVKPVNVNQEAILFNNVREISSAYYTMILNEATFNPDNILNFIDTNTNFDPKKFMPTIVGGRLLLSTFDDNGVSVAYTDHEYNGWIDIDWESDHFIELVNEMRWVYDS